MPVIAELPSVGVEAPTVGSATGESGQKVDLAGLW